MNGVVGGQGSCPVHLFVLLARHWQLDRGTLLDIRLTITRNRLEVDSMVLWLHINTAED